MFFWWISWDGSVGGFWVSGQSHKCDTFLLFCGPEKISGHRTIHQEPYLTYAFCLQDNNNKKEEEEDKRKSKKEKGGGKKQSEQAK